ncbi:MAG: hypothetical protein EAX91_13240 [Candidatus Lokiarchaeota archaeon]|nr:hypothetical protein [Candidatus Lokiarchaeota archaeon]
MSNTNFDDLFFYQVVRVKKHFFNTELKLSNFFFEITSIFPGSIIRIKNFVFFFVKPEDYYVAKLGLKKLRYLLKEKKILIIREDTTLIKLVFSFFEDVYIHDVLLIEKTTGVILDVMLLFKKDRAVAVGIEGAYIKTINYIFRNYISFNYPYNKMDGSPVELRCSLTTV